jgi:hypothetical protein
VAGDPDVARSVEALAPFGEKYVDQLATAYLVFSEKFYLSAIMEMVAATIEKDSGRDLVNAAAEQDFGMDPVSPAMSEVAGSTADGLFASAESNRLAANKVHSNDIGFPAPKESTSRPEQTSDRARVGTKVAPKQVLANLATAGAVATSVDIGQAQPEAGSLLDADETRDLADLLKKIS